MSLLNELSRAAWEAAEKLRMKVSSTNFHKALWSQNHGH
jgi:hypothetical protein